MPRGDGTGPAGLGPMTGRAAGYCAGYSAPGYTNPVGGRGFYGGAFGRGGFGGRGRGYRNWFYQTGLPGWYRTQVGLPAWGGYVDPNYAVPVGQINPEDEARILKEQASAIKQELDAINERVKELELSSKKDKKK